MVYTKSLAQVPQIIHANEKSSLKKEALFFALGVVLLTALAKLAVPLPFSPVPITGQTFGVFLISLLWGSKRSAAIVALYLLMGFSGLPIFAAIKGFHTVGYLVGMLAASLVIGQLADRGWAKSFIKSVLACLVGCVFIYALGLIVLSFYAPKGQLLQWGLYPFIPGAALKIFLAASISSRFKN